MSYATIPDSDLDQDSPVKEGVLRQLRDNALELAAGGNLPAGFPVDAFLIGTATVAGTVGGTAGGTTATNRGINISLPAASFFPNISGSFVGATLCGNTVDGNDPDATRLRIQYPGMLFAAAVTLSVTAKYVIEELPIYAFTNLTDSLLTAGNPITTEIMLGLGDLAGAVVTGADGAPLINASALDTATLSLAGTLSPNQVIGIELPELSFFPMLHSTGSDTLENSLRYPQLTGNPFEWSDDFTEYGPIPGSFSLANGPSGSAAYDVDVRYINDRAPSGVFVSVTPSDLGPDAVIRTGGMKRLRDNTLAILNAGTNAPKIVRSALNTSTVSLAGTVPGRTTVEITLSPYSFFPMFHTTTGGIGSTTKYARFPSMAVSRVDGADPDAPRFTIMPPYEDRYPSPAATPSYTYDVDYRYMVNT